MFLQILFWLLFIFWALGVLIPVPAGGDQWKRWCNVVLIILVGILAYVAFGNPIHR